MGNSDREKLQAVVIPDSFTKNFFPASYNISECCLPLLNSSCLDYTLKWLKSTGVNEVYLYCKSNHAKKIKEICKIWCRNPSEFNVIVFSIEHLSSVGEAMRDLYLRDLIKSDFILISGNVVSNVNLEEALKEHRRERESNSNIIMSCIYIANKESNGKEAFSTRTLQCLKNQQKLLSHKGMPQDASVKIPIGLINEAVDKDNDIRIMHRVQDPAIAVCSQDVLSFFADNFDFTTRDTFINDVIYNEDLHSYNINVMCLKDVYATNIERFSSFFQASQDLMLRKYFPTVVEKSPSTLRQRYNFNISNTSYYHLSAIFNANLTKDSVIDASTNINSSCTVVKSVIGKHCEIEEGCVVNESIIEDHVKLGKNCRINNCYIANGAYIQDNCTLASNSVVGAGVVLEKNKKIKEGTRLCLSEMSDEEAKVSSTFANKVVSVSLSGDYGCWSFPSFVEQYAESSCSSHDEFDEYNESLDSIGEEVSDEDRDRDDIEEHGLSDDEEEISPDFLKETEDMLLNAFENQGLSENVITEINALRLAYNVPLEDAFIKKLVKAVIEVGEKNASKVLEGKELLQSTIKGIFQFGEVINFYLKADGDNTNVLTAIEELIEEKERYLPLACEIISKLYDKVDKMDGNSIISWFNESDHNKSFFKMKAKFQKFITWLESDEEDSE